MKSDLGRVMSFTSAPFTIIGISAETPVRSVCKVNKAKGYNTGIPALCVHCDFSPGTSASRLPLRIPFLSLYSSSFSPSFRISYTKGRSLQKSVITNSAPSLPCRVVASRPDNTSFLSIFLHFLFSHYQLYSFVSSPPS